MAEITLGQFEPFPTAQGYATDGTYVRGWYSRSFQDSDGVEVQGGNGSTGFYINSQCTVTDGTITVPNLTVRTTIDANDPAPQSIQFSLRLYSNGSPRDWLTGTSGTPSGWIIYNPDPLTSWTFAQLQLLNQASYLANPPQTYPTTQTMIDEISASIGTTSYASSTHLGSTYTDPDPAVATHPVVVGTNNYRLTTQGIDIRAFGVVGDGVTDDTAAFQSAIDNSPLRRLFIPRTLTIKHTGLRIYGKIGLIIEGEKGGSYQDTASRFNYVGANNGKAFDIVNSGSILLKDLTISTGGYDTGAATYADIGVNIDKSADTGTYGTGSTSDVSVENCHIRGGETNANTPNSAFIGIQVNPSATSNCELMKFRRNSFFLGGVGDSDPTNTARGKGIVFVNAGNNSVNNVVEDNYVLGAYIAYEVRAGSQVRLVNNEANYPTIVYKITGIGNCLISSDRTETHRQFVVAIGSSVTLQSCIIPNGGWNASYPVVELQGGGKIISIESEFSAQAGIQAFGNTTTPTGGLIVVGGNVPDVTKSGFGTFTQKATAIGGTYMAGDNSQNAVITNAPIYWFTSSGAADTAESILEVDGSGFIQIGKPGVRQVRLHNDQLAVDGSSVADEMRLLLWDVTAGSLKRVSRGAADSGGAGFRCLRILN